VPQGEGAVSGMVFGIFQIFSCIDLNFEQRNGMVLIDFRLVCEKMTIFPYADYVVEFCAGLAFL